MVVIWCLETVRCPVVNRLLFDIRRKWDAAGNFGRLGKDPWIQVGQVFFTLYLLKCASVKQRAEAICLIPGW